MTDLKYDHDWIAQRLNRLADRGVIRGWRRWHEPPFRGGYFIYLLDGQGDLYRTGQTVAFLIGAEAALGIRGRS